MDRQTMNIASTMSGMFRQWPSTSSTVVAVMQSWLPHVQNHATSTVQRHYTNRGREYRGLENVTKLLAKRGIVHVQTAAHSSCANGVSGRMNRTLFDITRSLMIECRIPRALWGEGLCTARQIRNRLPSQSTNNTSPHELWFGNAPTFFPSI
jgi:hypothetical protein